MNNQRTTTLITNVRLVNEGQIREVDLRIEAGRIETIAAQLTARQGETVVEGHGRTLMPGMIDDQVHFREPGLTHKADLHSESLAAVAGGITSYMDMPNTRPTTTSSAALRDKLALAKGRSCANYAFYLGATNDNIEEIKRLDPHLACGIKVFMGASTGNMLVDRRETLEQIFRHAPTVVATHCEDTPMILANLRRYEERFGPNIPVEHHPGIRSAEACYASSSFAVSLAREHGTQLHVLHLSTADELALFQPGPIDEKQITAEACVHFLHFSDSDYAALGNRIKCNPAIKSKQHQQALIAAIKDGRIDIVATDHAPHLPDEKSGDYRSAAAGLPLVQRALQVLLERFHDGDFSLELIAERVAHAPAKRFAVKERGFVREGYHADLVLIDLNQEETDSDAKSLYRCEWSPFAGYRFRSRIASTWVNGVQVFDGNEVRKTEPGCALEFVRR